MDRMEYAPDTFRSRLLEILVGGDERAKARAYQELNDYYVANRDQSRMVQKQRETIDELRKSLQGSKAEIQAKEGNTVTLERKLGWADGRVSKLDDKIVKLNEALSKQKKTISDQKATISEKEKEIRLLKQQVRELKACVASPDSRPQATSNNSSLPPSKIPSARSIRLRRACGSARRRTAASMVIRARRSRGARPPTKWSWSILRYAPNAAFRSAMTIAVRRVSARCTIWPSRCFLWLRSISRSSTPVPADAMWKVSSLPT